MYTHLITSVLFPFYLWSQRCTCVAFSCVFCFSFAHELSGQMVTLKLPLDEGVVLMYGDYRV
jgi:hypothetical protein